jgi:hypothetical protein
MQELAAFGDPDLFGAGHLQSLDQVRIAGEVVVAVGRPPPGRGLALEAHRGHKPPDSLAVDRPSDGVGLALAEIDPERVARVRRAIPVGAHSRPAL